MQQIVPGMTHQMTQLGGLGIGCHNPPAGQKGPTYLRLALCDMVTFPTLQSNHTNLRHGYVAPALMMW